MRPAASLASKELALLGPETVLFVDDRKSKVCELNVLFDQGVCSNDQRAVTRRGRQSHAAAFRRALAADEQLDCEPGKTRLKVCAEAM
jgi:hypothetical protein